mgnify:CR=1 FL=1
MARTTLNLFLTAAAAALGLSAAAFADELGGLEFATVDADGDGFITYAEIAAVAPRASREQFQDFDTNDDARLDREEYEAWLNNFVGRDPDER